MEVGSFTPADDGPSEYGASRKRKKNSKKNPQKIAKYLLLSEDNEMDPQVGKYLLHTLEVLKGTTISTDEKVKLANKAIEYVATDVVKCSCDRRQSFVIQQFLPYLSNAAILRISDALSVDLRLICSNISGSRVLEALLSKCQEIYTVEPKDEDAQHCNRFISKVSRFTLNNMETWMWDAYGNHTMRLCLNIMSSNSTINDEFRSIITDSAERLFLWPQFEELLHTDLTSGFLQTLLRVLKLTNKKLLRKYIRKLIDIFSENKNVFESLSVTMVIETIMEISKKKYYSKLFSTIFAGNLHTLSTRAKTRITIEKLIKLCRATCDFESIMKELANHFVDILNVGHSSIILNLAQGCQRLNACQGLFMQALMGAFNCWDPDSRQDDAIRCLLRMEPYTDGKNVITDNDWLKLNGVLLIETILNFNKPIVLVKSLLSMEQSELQILFLNKMGCHVADSFMASNFVGEKNRVKLVKKLQGIYKSIVSSKYGSRAFEAIWNASSLGPKLLIIEELANKDADWVNNMFGQIIALKVKLSLYKKNRKTWETCIHNTNKANELFANIIN